MPYADPEKLRAVKRESARRRRAADPQAARAYDRTQKQRWRAEQRAGESATSREVELLQRYSERAYRSVRARPGRDRDPAEWIEASGVDEPWTDEHDERLKWDNWTPRAGYNGFTAPFAYDEEERLWLAYYRLLITPPLLRGLGIDSILAPMLLCYDSGPDVEDWRWIQEYGLEGEKRAIEVAATLFGEGNDVRRLARYLRHHPSSWEELEFRLERRLPGQRLDRAVDRLRRLGYLHIEGPSALIR